MNCKQFNSIKLEEILSSLGYHPTKQSQKELWFLNPFGDETQASFKIDINKNQWFLFSDGIGGNNIDFVRRYLNCSVKEVLSWAGEQNFFSFHQQTDILEPRYKINEVSELQNWNLKKYLKERGLSSKIYRYLYEVKFIMNGKKLYAIGFKNDSGGWEFRNSFFKGSILKKDISLIKNGCQNVCVFEGFIDALSYIEKQDLLDVDILVLNSVSLINKAIETLKNYNKISLFLDNDRAGIKCKNEFITSFPEALDYSHIYQNYKDLNEYITHEKPQIIRGVK